MFLRRCLRPRSTCVRLRLTSRWARVRRWRSSRSTRVRVLRTSRSSRLRAVVPRRSNRRSSRWAFSGVEYAVVSSWTVEMTLSRAIRAAPTGTRTAFSAYSVTRSTGVLASSARVSAALRAAVLRLRAVAAWLRARVCAARLAEVDRFVAAVFRVVVAVEAMMRFLPLSDVREIDRVFVAYQRTHVCKPPNGCGYTPDYTGVFVRSSQAAG